MSPLSLSRAAQFVCTGCHTTKNKIETSWELGTAVSGSQRGGKRCCHQSFCTCSFLCQSSSSCSCQGSGFRSILPGFSSSVLPWLCLLSALPKSSFAEECISSTALPKSLGRLQKQREEGIQKMDHILGCFLCLLGFPLALIPLIMFTGSPLMQADRNRKK